MRIEKKIVLAGGTALAGAAARISPVKTLIVDGGTIS
jgi:hypothetical protein